MNLYTSSILVTILANLGYHICQKEIRNDTPPLLSLAASYIVGLLSTVMIIGLFPRFSGVTEIRQIKQIGPASYLLGFALIGLELGFLLVYRSGWKISLASIVSNVSVALLLLPLGIIIYKEQFGTEKVVGTMLSILGIYLLSKE